MAITAALVKELRERTGAGMMECKKALVETNGDIDLAIENMRKAGQAKADKKAGRVAAEGVIVTKLADDKKSACMVEVNCETDFVAKDESFVSFSEAVAARVMASDVADVEALMASPIHDGEETTIEEARQALISKIGENMNVRRFQRFSTEGGLASYLHGVRIGVVVDMAGGDETLARDVAMHIAATNPVCLDESGVPEELLQKEREIIEAQSADSGKPPEIMAKMIDGRIKKYLKEITLVNQPFVKDPDQTVAKLVSAAGTSINGFTRFEVGEGIEKKKENFAEEVMAQAKL